MQKVLRPLLTLALGSVLLAASGCGNPAATSSGTSSSAVSGAAASANSTPSSAVPASDTVKYNPLRDQTVIVGGLKVSLVVPAHVGGITAGTKYAINLRAENSTDATMALKVVGNPPQLIDGRGIRVADLIAGSGLGPGIKRPAARAGALPKRPKAGDTDSLPPHMYITGALATRFDTTGQNYTVKWDLGPGRVAMFRLP